MDGRFFFSLKPYQPTILPIKKQHVSSLLLLLLLFQNNQRHSLPAQGELRSSRSLETCARPRDAARRKRKRLSRFEKQQVALKEASFCGLFFEMMFIICRCFCILYFGCCFVLLLFLLSCSSLALGTWELLAGDEAREDAPVLRVVLLPQKTRRGSGEGVRF